MKPVIRQEGDTIDLMIKRYNRKRRQAGIPESLRRHEYYVRPGERRRIKHKAAVEKQRKQAAHRERQLDRADLIAKYTANRRAHKEPHGSIQRRARNENT